MTGCCKGATTLHRTTISIFFDCLFQRFVSENGLSDLKRIRRFNELTLVSEIAPDVTRHSWVRVWADAA